MWSYLSESQTVVYNMLNFPIKFDKCLQKILSRIRLKIGTLCVDVSTQKDCMVEAQVHNL